MYIPFQAPVGPGGARAAVVPALAASGEAAPAASGSALSGVVDQIRQRVAGLWAGTGPLGAWSRDMAYRSQLAYPVLSADDDFRYFFGSSNTPGLGATVAAGGEASDIPLQLQSDAPFALRGLAIGCNPVVFQPRLKDPSGDYLSDGFLDAPLTYIPSGTIGAGFQIIALEPEIVCDAGSLFLLYMSNISGAPASLVGSEVVFFGVKREAKN